MTNKQTKPAADQYSLMTAHYKSTRLIQVILAVAGIMMFVDAKSSADESTEVETVSTSADDSSGDNQEQKEDETPIGWYLDIFAKQEYRFRYSTVPKVESTILDGGRDSTRDLSRGGDQDLHLFFGGSMRDYKDRFYVTTSMGLFADIDGFVSSGQASTFSSTNENAASTASLVNRSHEAVRFDIYTLSGEYYSRKVLALARVGRQISEHGKTVSFDGAAFDLRLYKSYLGMFLLGGRSVHFFETDPNLYEDWLASTGFVIRPLKNLKLELEYRMNAEDSANHNTLLDGVTDISNDKITDHTYGISAWYHYGDFLYLKGYFRGLGASAADAGGIFNLDFNPIETSLDLRVDAQLMSYRQINESDNPYFAVLGESLPHIRMNADLKKSFSQDKGIYTMHVGWAARMLTQDVPSAFNRDHGRVYFAFDAADIVLKGPFISAIAEFHYDHQNDSNRIITVGGSVGYDQKLIRLEAGTYYNRVKYTYYADVNEIEDVRTYYADIKLKPIKWFTVRAKYELEQFDRLIHTAVLTLTQVY